MKNAIANFKLTGNNFKEDEEKIYCSQVQIFNCEL